MNCFLSLVLTIVLVAFSCLGLDYTYKPSVKFSSDWECERQTGSLFYDMPPRSMDELTRFVVPNNLIFVWCENKTFEFKHFLSVKSAWRFLEPERIMFYYYHKPKQDDYNDWLNILKTTMPNLQLEHTTTLCGECRRNVIGHLHNYGGIYLTESTILLSSLSSYRRGELTMFLGEEVQGEVKVIISTPQNNSLWTAGCITHDRHRHPGSVFKTVDCSKVDDLNSNISISTGCVYLNRKVVPRDILTSSNNVAVRLREIAYGVSEPIVPRHDEQMIPKVIHYIWYNPVNMTFFMYLSILSSLSIVKPEHIYVHGGQDIYGPYWEKVKHHPKVHIIHREKTRWIFGNKVILTHHFSDVIRADVLYKYGGIYVDWDVLWVKPVDDLLSTRFDVIMNVDHMDRHPFPDTINAGVILSKPRSKFIKLWRETYKRYRPDEFEYNPIRAPYKVYERYPTSLRLEPRLQVICFQLKCHPVFHPDYKIFTKAHPFNWTTDVYSIHITYPDPEAYQNETALREGHGMFAEIGQYIMDMSRNWYIHK